MQNKISPRVPKYNILVTLEDIQITDVADIIANTTEENYIIWIDITGASPRIITGKQPISNQLYITSDAALPSLELILCNGEEYNKFVVEATFTGGTQILNTENIETAADISFEVPSKYDNEHSLYFILWPKSSNILETSAAIPCVPSKRIKIENSTTGSSIYYTTDGNDPLNTANLYSTPFDVLKGTTVKAKAFKEGMRSSDVATLIVN